MLLKHPEIPSHEAVVVVREFLQKVVEVLPEELGIIILLFRRLWKVRQMLRVSQGYANALEAVNLIDKFSRSNFVDDGAEVEPSPEPAFSDDGVENLASEPLFSDLN